MVLQATNDHEEGDIDEEMVEADDSMSIATESYSENDNEEDEDDGAVEGPQQDENGLIVQEHVRIEHIDFIYHYSPSMLTVLEITYCDPQRVHDIPSEFQSLRCLEKLTLVNGAICRISNLQNCCKLEYLDLSRQWIRRVGTSLSANPKLKTLVMDYNYCLIALSEEEMESVKGLRKLSLSCTRLHNFWNTVRALKKLRRLQELYLRNTCLRSEVTADARSKIERLKWLRLYQRCCLKSQNDLKAFQPVARKSKIVKVRKSKDGDGMKQDCEVQAGCVEGDEGSQNEFLTVFEIQDTETDASQNVLNAIDMLLLSTDVSNLKMSGEHRKQSEFDLLKQSEEEIGSLLKRDDVESLFAAKRILERFYLSEEELEEEEEENWTPIVEMYYYREMILALLSATLLVLDGTLITASERRNAVEVYYDKFEEYPSFKRFTKSVNTAILLQHRRAGTLRRGTLIRKLFYNSKSLSIPRPPPTRPPLSPASTSTSSIPSSTPAAKSPFLSAEGPVVTNSISDLVATGGGAAAAPTPPTCADTPPTLDLSHWFKRHAVAALYSSADRPYMRDLSPVLPNGRRLQPRQFEYHPTRADRMIIGTMSGELAVLNPRVEDAADALVASWQSQQNDMVLGLTWMRRQNFNNKFIAGSDDGSIRMHDVNRMKKGKGPVHAYKDFKQLTALHSNSLDEKFIVSGYSNDVALYDIESGSRLNVFPELHEDQHINVLKFANRHPHLFATCSFDCTVKLWDLREKVVKENALFVKRSSKGTVMVCFSDDDKYLLSSAVDNEVVQYCVRTGKKLIAYELKPSGHSINYSRAYYMWGPSQEPYVIIGSCDDAQIHAFNAETGQHLRDVELTLDPNIDPLSTVFCQSLRGDPFAPLSLSALVYPQRLITPRHSPSNRCSLLQVDFLRREERKDEFYGSSSSA